MKILLASSDEGRRELLWSVLCRDYDVFTVSDGLRALKSAQSNQYDGILLDTLLPDGDGLSVLTALRQAGYHTPVMLFSAEASVEDRIAGLDAGADDYLYGDFAAEELLARIRALLRRPFLKVQHLSIGALQLDEMNSILLCKDRTVPLSHLEEQLMAFFMRNSGIFFSTETLRERVWGIDSNADIGTVWVYISSLRKKLRLIGADAQIHSRRGIGYALKKSDP